MCDPLYSSSRRKSLQVLLEAKEKTLASELRKPNPEANRYSRTGNLNSDRVHPLSYHHAH